MPKTTASGFVTAKKSVNEARYKATYLRQVDCSEAKKLAVFSILQESSTQR